MLSEKRIRLMTKAAEFEQREGQGAFRVNEYYRGDYVSFHMVKAAISGTFAYIVLLVLWGFSQVEALLGGLHTMDLQTFIMGFLKWYVLFLAVMEVIVFFAYNTKYTRTRELMKDYYQQLGEIGRLYEEEDKRLDGRDTMGGPENDDDFV